MLRNSLGPSQAEFATRYGIPVANIRQYEIGRTMPPPAVRAFLKVIASEPERAAAAGQREGRIRIRYTVPGTPRRGKKLDKVGMDAADTSDLYFDDVFVPGDNLLGGEEGKGFYQLMGELPQERLVIAVGAMSTIEKALDTTVEYVKQRKAFGQTIWDFQNTQFVLADLKARGTAAKVFLNDCVAKLLRGELDVTTAPASPNTGSPSCRVRWSTNASSSTAAGATSTNIPSPGCSATAG